MGIVCFLFGHDLRVAHINGKEALKCITCGYILGSEFDDWNV